MVNCKCNRSRRLLLQSLSHVIDGILKSFGKVGLQWIGPKVDAQCAPIQIAKVITATQNFAANDDQGFYFEGILHIHTLETNGASLPRRMIIEFRKN